MNTLLYLIKASVPFALLGFICGIFNFTIPAILINSLLIILEAIAYLLQSENIFDYILKYNWFIIIRVFLRYLTYILVINLMLF